ncbi:hypothetical protein [Borrelia puertoricensis]|uniref:hypothetical protein n=1 Tax=Borrelia puertoricensis TaxID=2756107 RepID=UPI001FF2A607|nr:hypothetical protein [Borrelia puertoricensis]UPA19076.1 hypothetical protein bpuSUM_001621 [Borrelia puertoricensis]
MRKIDEIKLYKVGEVVEILKSEFNYQISTQVLCRKASNLGAYITYNDINYLPEEIISDLTVNVKQRKTKLTTQMIIADKLEKIKKNLEAYDKIHKIPAIKAIKNIKSRNTNTNTIIKAVIQLKEEMKKTKEEMKKTTEKMEDKNQEIIKLKKEMQKTIEEIQEKNEEIERLKRVMQKTREDIKEEIEDKNQEIIKLKKEIKNIKEQTQETIQINLLKEVKTTLNNLVYKEPKSHLNTHNKKNT